MQEKIKNVIIEIFTSEKSKLFSDLDQIFDQWENSFDKYEETFDIKFSDIADRFRIKFELDVEKFRINLNNTLENELNMLTQTQTTDEYTKRRKDLRIMNIGDLCCLIDDERKPIKIYLKKMGSKKLTIIEGLPKKRFQEEIRLQWIP